MRKLAVALGCAAMVSAGLAAPSQAADQSTLAVYGDAPYGSAAFSATPGFVASVNADPDVGLVVHAGDIHSGSQTCTQAWDQSVFDLWTSFEDPLVYTPGDNEWTDCHKVGEGGGQYNPATGKIDYVRTDGNEGAPVDYAKGNPVANLDLVRSIFFPVAGQTIGGSPRAVSSQALWDGSEYVENVMWEQADTLFVTLNLPGGSNNDADPWYKTPTASNQQLNEVKHRTAADLAWIDAAFARAADDEVGAVVIVEQADMWDLDGKAPSHIVNYEQFITKIADKTTAFAKPVLLFNGDSHVYRSDNPLVNNAPCATETGACSDDAYDNHPGIAPNVPNFHRVVVHGNTLPLEWLKLSITPGVDNGTSATTFGPFSWERMN